MKTIIKKLLGRYNHITKEISCESKWFGSEYGGFYVLPKLLNKRSIVYSFGIGKDISFDKEIIRAFNCKVYGFDPTPKSIKWCEGQTLPENFIFLPFGIAKKTGIYSFNLPKNENHVSGSIKKHNHVSAYNTIDVQMKSFRDIIKTLGHKTVDLIKMDIEGAEYDVLENILESDVCINQIVLEIHERFFRHGKEKTKEAIDLLRKYGFLLYEKSKNYEELSFVNQNTVKNLDINRV